MVDNDVVGLVRAGHVVAAGVRILLRLDHQARARRRDVRPLRDSEVDGLGVRAEVRGVAIHPLVDPGGKATRERRPDPDHIGRLAVVVDQHGPGAARDGGRRRRHALARVRHRARAAAHGIGRDALATLVDGARAAHIVRHARAVPLAGARGTDQRAARHAGAILLDGARTAAQRRGRHALAVLLDGAGAADERAGRHTAPVDELGAAAAGHGFAVLRAARSQDPTQRDGKPNEARLHDRAA